MKAECPCGVGMLDLTLTEIADKSTPCPYCGKWMWLRGRWVEVKPSLLTRLLKRIRGR